MTTGLPWLSLVVWTPIVGGIWVLLGSGGKSASTARAVALAVSVLTFLLSLPLYILFDTSTYQMQFVELAPWIDAFSINYHLGIDGISMPLILLTTFTTVLVVIAGWEVIQYKVPQYLAAFLVLEGLMIGAFSALDAVLFYVFWEALLIPMFLIIGIWGGERRVYATVKFFLYTFLGSVLMLVAILYLYAQAGSFSILDMHALPLGHAPQILIFIAFLIAFAVKVPMWPVHTWLPDAHVEAPTGGSVILAAIMLKLGGYGFVRFSLPITPDASQTLAALMIGLSLVAIVYIGFVALMQPDMKKLIAYSSISHMGFATLGFFIAFSLIDSGASDAAALGIQGGLVQMLSHGFISGALFLCVGVMYDRLAQPSDRRLRRRGQHHAGVCCLYDAVCDGQLRAPRHIRLRGRVHGHTEQLPGQFLDRIFCGNHSDPRRRIHAMDVQACDLRSRCQRGRGGALGHQRA